MIPPSNKTSRDRPPKHSIWSLETIGFVLLAILILIFTILRYGRNIPWGAR